MAAQTHPLQYLWILFPSRRAARTFRESLGGKVRDLSRPEPVLDTEWYKVLGDMDSNAEELDTAVFPIGTDGGIMVSHRMK